jgi:hypothetical protein
MIWNFDRYLGHASEQHVSVRLGLRLLSLFVSHCRMAAGVARGSHEPGVCHGGVSSFGGHANAIRTAAGFALCRDFSSCQARPTRLGAVLPARQKGCRSYPRSQCTCTDFVGRAAGTAGSGRSTVAGALAALGWQGAAPLVAPHAAPPANHAASCVQATAGGNVRRLLNFPVLQ